MKVRSRQATGEDGSSLIIALVFVVIFSLLVATVISFAEVGLKASRSFDDKAQSTYAVDGAVDAAINRFREGGQCGNYTAPAGPDGPLGDRGLIVRCVDDDRPATGKTTKPGNALLSLGSEANEGISTVGEQRVLGNIFSNSTVTAGATLIVQGQVSATGNCNVPPGNIQTSPEPNAVHCADTDGAADASQGRDPQFTKALSAVPVRRAVPPCPAGWLVKLEPGHYDDAAALSAFTTVPPAPPAPPTPGACPGKVVWLHPGNYYFDFTFRGGAGTWTIDDPNVAVVAGTPRGWDPNAAVRPPISVPGSCKTVDDPGVVDGVQLIAGGGTHFRILRGQVEVCAEPSTSDQSIALYGIAPDRAYTIEPTGWTTVDGFADPVDATTIGEAPVPPATGPPSATAVLASGPTRSASLTLTAFRPGVPDGSLIDSATLRVSHSELGDMDDASRSVTVAADFPGSTCTGAQAVPVPVSLGGFSEDRIDLKAACGLSDPAAFAELEVTYSAALRTGGADGTADLDGIAVEVAYRSPNTRKPTVVSASSGFTDPANPPANALEIGEQPGPKTADAGLNGDGPPSASITVAGLGEPPIPPGSRIDSAKLRVAHQEQGGVEPTVTVPFTGGNCVDRTLPVRTTGIVDDRVDLKACGLLSASDLVGLTATYKATATTGAAASARLDGMWLELVYRPPTRSPVNATASATPAVFTTPDNAKAVGEQPVPLTSDADLSSGAQTASLALTDFSQPALPAGSVIDAAVLRVVHQDVGPMDVPTLSVAFPGIGTCSPVLTRQSGTLGEDRVDLTACGLTNSANLAGLGVTYTANLTAGAPNGATARVDGIVLDLAYRPPATRRPTTASTTTPGFTGPNNARIIGESPTPLTADVTLANGAAPASVTVGGYNSVLPLPAGAVIDSAVLRVAHQEDAWMGAPKLATAFDANTCAANPPQTLPLSPGGLGVFRSIDLTTCGLTRGEQLGSLAATFTASPPPTASTRVPATTIAVNGFTNPDSGRAIDALTADAVLDAGGATSASITLDDYDQPPPPAGTSISAATLRIAHRDNTGQGVVTVTVLFTGGTCAPQTFEPGPTISESTIDLLACGLTDPAKLDGLTVTYAAGLGAGATAATVGLDGAVINLTYQAPPPATARLDGIELDIVFRAPTLRALDGCLTRPSSDPAACQLVKVAPAAGDATTRFAAQGTVYAPTAALDISMNGLTNQVLTRGLVARTIRLGLRAGPGYTRPLMGVPPEPVKFTAYPDVTARATATAPPSPNFVPADNAKAVGEKPAVLSADATFNSANPTTASITLGAYTQAALPEGSPIEAAVLRVAHREDSGVGAVSVTVGGLSTGPCGGGSSKSFPLPLYESPPATPAGFGEDQIDLTAACELSTAQLTGLAVTYSATVPAAPAVDTVAYLDGITLDLLAGPLLRARVAFDTTQDTVEIRGWSVLR